MVHFERVSFVGVFAEFNQHVNVDSYSSNKRVLLVCERCFLPESNVC